MKRKYWVLLIVFFWILFVDQWTKYAVQQRLALHRSVVVIHGFFNLTHVRNTGGAFGFLGGEKGGIGSLFFIVVSLIAIGTLLFLFVRLKDGEETLSFSFSLVMSGAVGNLIDRLLYGEVVDFFDFYISSFHWPAFNIADSAISLGIGLMALELLIRDHRKSTKLQAPNTK
jgi:signal peptidase II